MQNKVHIRGALPRADEDVSGKITRSMPWPLVELDIRPRRSKIYQLSSD